LSFDGHSSSVFAVYLHDKILFSGSYDTTIICWDSESGALIKIFLGHFGYVIALAAQGNDLYSVGFDDKIIRWNIISGTIVRQFPVRHTSTVRCIALRNQTLFSGSDDTTIIKWNVTAGLPLFVYEGREISLRAVAIWKTFIISAGNNEEITFWSASINDIDPRATIMAHLRPVSCLLVYEETLFSGSSDRTIKQWNLTDFALLKVLGGKNLSALI
jgi:WD40 repeat protein